MPDAPLPEVATDADLLSLYNAVKRAFREADLATPDLDARLLVTETLGVTTAQLIANPRMRVPDALADELRRRVGKRLSGQSIGRILGRRAFWSLDLRVGPDTLEPRPETETVVELALAALQPPDAGFRIADLGIGTGAILLAILSERLHAYGVGVDISDAALREAVRNAERHNLEGRAGFVAGDFGDALGRYFDVVVSNPPYIATAEIETLSPTVRDHDPRVALDGGIDGLDAYRTVFAQARQMLRPSGQLIVEIAPAACADVIAEADRAGLVAVHVANDLNGDPRAIAFRFVTA
jgi:release factor glutamine methyltransferase